METFAGFVCIALFVLVIGGLAHWGASEFERGNLRIVVKDWRKGGRVRGRLGTAR